MGRLRSEQATRDRHAIRGYLSTATKHGVHVLTAIHDALAGQYVTGATGWGSGPKLRCLAPAAWPSLARCIAR